MEKLNSLLTQTQYLLRHYYRSESSTSYIGILTISLTKNKGHHNFKAA